MCTTSANTGGTRYWWWRLIRRARRGPRSVSPGSAHVRRRTAAAGAATRRSSRRFKTPATRSTRRRWPGRAAALTPRHSTYRRSTGHSRRCADGGSQPAAQLRPNKLQRSARKRSHSANTRTVPTPRTATFLTHRLTIASENSRQPRVSGSEKSRNRRLAIVVAPCLHLGGLSGDAEAILGCPHTAYHPAREPAPTMLLAGRVARHVRRVTWSGGRSRSRPDR